MNLNELRKLSPTQALQAAAEELALPTDFFDRMWKQESGRGQNMTSRAGARGHFQTMPATQRAWEQRHKVSLNPDDFHDSLFMAVETMRENLGRFKDPVDATRAYNAGWDAKKWGNPETVGYVAALWGDRAPAKATGAPAGATQEEWPTLPTLAKGNGAPAHAGDDAAAIGVGTMFSTLNAGNGDAAQASMAAREAEDRKVQARKDATGFGDVVSEALRDPRVMPTWALLEKFSGDSEPDPNYDYMARREEIEEGLSDDERAYLRENAVNEDTERRALAELHYRRSIDQTYGDAGGFAAFAGQMAAGLADPAGLLLGLGTVKAFQLARIGSGALVAQGRGGAAVASMMAENAAANVAIEGLADAVGEVKTSSDYALAAAAGAGLVAPFSRGVLRQAAEAEVRTLARGLQERAVQEQLDKATAIAKADPTLPPEQIARRLVDEEAEQINKAVSETTGPTKQDTVIPETVRREMEDEFNGVEVQDTATATTDTSGKDNYSLDEAYRKREEYLRERDNVIQQIQDKGEVTRETTDTATGQTIRLNWNARGPKLKGHGNVAEVLTAIATHPRIKEHEAKFAAYLSKVMTAESMDVDVRIIAREARSFMDPNGPQVKINDAKAVGNDLTTKVHGLSQYGIYGVLHEFVHVATYHRINAWEEAADKLRPEQRRIMEQFQDLFNRFQEQVKVEKARQGGKMQSGRGAQYAAKNLHEFAAQFFTDLETRNILGNMPGKPVAGRVTTALREVMSLIKRVLGLEGKSSAMEEGAKLIDQMIAMPVDNVVYNNGKRVFSAYDETPPMVPGPEPGANGFNPIAAQRSRDKWAQQMIAHAEAYLAKNPINMERLKTLTMKIGGASDGLVLAASKNPIMQLVASLVTETTTGAAGRKANVAIRARMLQNKYVGNALSDYDNAYTIYRNRNGGGVIEDAWRGEVRRKFDQKVHEEVLRRKLADYTPSADKSVVEAADALEGLFERARIGQVDAGVLGFANLPESSRGYMPQALDGAKLAAASVEDLALLHKALAQQFVERIGFDQKFAEQFAPFYTERVRLRAMGDRGVESMGAGGEGLQLIRDTLDEFNGDPAMVDRARAALSKQGQGHTKKRLDVDLLTELRPGLRMMDFYNTNPLLLARSYAKRTAGTVSLTEAGIHGIRGARELRQAALFKQSGTEVTKAELDAYDRVIAEILGTPVAGAVVSAGASNMQLLVGLQRLGGLVFTQAAETYNMIHHVGLKATLAGVKDLPRILGEVGRLKRGLPSENHILTSIEAYGGEIGMEGYKMVAPLDAPDGRLGEYIDQPGLLSRLLRSGGHLQSKISGFRGLMAAQHRMVAEQIVMKAARFIRDGKNGANLADMGFTPEVVDAVRADLKHTAKWDANDRLVEFDLTRVSDARTAEAFVQAVHRGTSQIIQGTFIGERNAWMHNDYMRLLMQLRTFGLTATEKQWGRTRMNHGTAYAAGMLLGQMALSLPIHAARVQLMAAGREDREEYIKNSMSPAALVRATMNYSSLSGLAGDLMEVGSGVIAGWGGQSAKEVLGARQQAASFGRIVPAAGSLDTLSRAASGKADLHTALKQLPFSNLWYLVPAINLTKD